MILCSTNGAFGAARKVVLVGITIFFTLCMHRHILHEMLCISSIKTYDEKQLDLPKLDKENAVRSDLTWILSHMSFSQTAPPPCSDIRASSSAQNGFPHPLSLSCWPTYPFNTSALALDPMLSRGVLCACLGAAHSCSSCLMQTPILAAHCRHR